MKKILFSMGVMLASAFALTNCTTEMDQPVKEPSATGSFEIIANTADTKTANDGMSTKWVAKDSINVFHSVAGSKTYVNDNYFVVDPNDPESGRFTGNLGESLSADGVYDWYAFYPYTKQKETPADRETGYAYIGHSKGLNQNGYDNMAALKGSVCPLYGVAEAVAGNKLPNLTMQHLSSVVAIEVTNTTDAPLVVRSASFSAPEEIVGSFFIDFSGDAPVYIPSPASAEGKEFAFTTATVNVNGGTELKKGDKAVLYLAIKPFTANVEDDLTITVNGYEKPLTMTKDVTFHAGKIKTLKFDYNYVSTAKVATFDFNANEWELPLSSNTDEEKHNGNITQPVVSGDVTMTAYNPASNEYKIRMWQGTSKIDLRAYTGSSLVFSVPEGYVITKMDFAGSKVADASFAPTTGSYATKVWNGKSNPVVITFTATVNIDSIVVEYEEGSGDTPELPEDSGQEPEEPEQPEQPSEPKAVSVAEFLDAAEDDQIYILTGTIKNVTNTFYGNFDIEDETGSVLVYGIVDESGNKVFESKGLKEGDVLTVKGKRSSYNGTKQMKNAVYVSHESSGTAEPEPEPGEVKEVTAYEFNNATDNNVEYQVSGTISGIYEAYNASYNNISIYVSDETGEILAYRLSCEGITDPANTLTKGDLITVKGKRTLYNENPQMAQGCVIVEHKDVEIETPAGSATLSFADKANRTSFSTSQQVWEQNGIKLTNDKGASTSNVADYAAPARFYKSSKITVEYPGMTKIEFTCNAGKYADALKTSITSGTVTVNGSVVTVELETAADSYVISSLTGGQVRMDSVTVYSE